MNRLIKKGLLFLSSLLAIIIVIPKQTTSLAFVKPTSKAIVSEYNSKGHWQNQRTIKIQSVGIHRTHLKPNKEYGIQKIYTELGPNRQTQLESYCECKGKVAFFDNWKGCRNIETMIDLAIKDGAVAFLIEDNDIIRQMMIRHKRRNCIYDIPFFFTTSNMPTFLSKSKIKLKKKEEEEDNSTQSLEENNSNNKPGESEKCDNISLERLESSTSHHAKNDDLLPTNFTLKDVGIGGLSKELETLFRRTIATRLLKAETLVEMGINPVRGLLLHGPPGCGKTLIARKLSQLVNAKKITIKSGSEMFSMWFGESEANIRELFMDAEDEWEEKGMKSGLHVIIIDEIDAICSARASGEGDSDKRNSIINQLLAKMDGVESINNVLVIGMTNRKDILDSALLRPGRLEVHIEIALPKNEQERLEILLIHTKKLRASGRMNDNTSSKLIDIAKVTDGYSGAELEGLIKEACSFAIECCIMDKNGTFLTNPDETKIMVVYDDLKRALEDRSEV